MEALYLRSDKFNKKLGENVNFRSDFFYNFFKNIF